MKKRFLAALLALCLILLLTGCSGKGLGTGEELLSPPEPSGEYAEIFAALKNSVTAKYTLKYPTKGDYRSAIIVSDLNGDKQNEAVAFYSTTEENTVMVHINFIEKSGEEYKSIGDIKIVGSDVECVEFADLDNNGNKEIIVGYNVYGNVDKQVAVYEVSKGVPVQKCLEKYTEFIICDLDFDGVSGLFIAEHDAAAKTATAKLMQVEGGNIVQKGTCALDGNVTSLYPPKLTKLESGRPAVYIDAVKGNGTLTEVVYYDNGVLSNPFFDPETLVTTSTFRQSSVTCRDINSDSILEIPMLSLLPTASNLVFTENVSVTKWCVPEGNNLIVAKAMNMNYIDGYSLRIPDNLSGNICIMQNADSRLRVVYLYDEKTGKATYELFRVQVVSENLWDSAEFKKEGLSVLARENGLVYVFGIGNFRGANALTKEQIVNIFALIEEE
jgi:hypothetical protein